MNTGRKSSDGAFAFALYFLLFSAVLALAAVALIFISVSVFGTLEEKNSNMRTDILDADVFSDGAAVIIDAGHGGEDGGAVEGDIYEKDLNLDIAFKLRDMLTAAGVRVIMTRTEDILLYDRNADYMGHKKSLDLRARLEIAKSVPESLFISIHMNAFPDSRYSGLQVWFSKNDSGSRILAEAIQNNVKNMLQPENERKIKAADSSIYLLDRAVSEAVLVECGFLSNSDECDKLADSAYRQRLAFVIFSSIKEYLQNNGCK